MASLSTDPRGNRRILFATPDGGRKTIYLGKVAKRQGEAVKVHVEQLANALGTNTAPPLATTQWLSTIDAKLYGKLVAVGLAADRSPALSTTLAAFLDGYLAKRQSLVQSGKLSADTLRIDRVTRDNLVAHFGAAMELSAINKGSAGDFRTYLLTIGGVPAKKCGPEIVIRQRTPLAEATARKRCAVASRFFRDAMRRGLIAANPFDSIPKSNIATKRRALISDPDARKVLDLLPTLQWQLLFALSRWGGLRVGSEVRKLRWADVDWLRGRMLIHSPKTEHHAGHESRWLPIFPELRELLVQQHKAAKGEPLVLPMLVGRTDSALRTTLIRAIGKAGLTVWPRLWHSLRATRQTELEDRFPSHVVCAWLGNSKQVARDHYLQVTDEHFVAAAELLRRDPKPTQNPTQQAAAGSGTEQHGAGDDMRNPRGKAKGPRKSDDFIDPKAVGEGFEPPIHFRVRRFSRPVHSTALPPDRCDSKSIAPAAGRCKADGRTELAECGACSTKSTRRQLRHERQPIKDPAGACRQQHVPGGNLAPQNMTPAVRSRFGRAGKATQCPHADPRPENGGAHGENKVDQ